MNSMKQYVCKAFNWSKNHKLLITTGSLFYYTYKKAINFYNRREEAEMVGFQKKVWMEYQNSLLSAKKYMMNRVYSKIDEIAEISKRIGILKSAELTPEEKKEHWDNLKIHTFTSIVTLAYATAIVQSFLVVSVALYSKYIMKVERMRRAKIDDSLGRPIDDLECSHMSSSLSQSYSTMMDHFVQFGLAELYDTVNSHACNVLGCWSLQEECNLSNFEEILFGIRSNVESSKSFVLESFVLPPQGQRPEKDTEWMAYREITDQEKLGLLMAELRILLGSYPLKHIARHITQQVFVDLTAAVTSKLSQSESGAYLIAKLIPILNNLRKELSKKEDALTSAIKPELWNDFVKSIIQIQD